MGKNYGKFWKSNGDTKSTIDSGLIKWNLWLGEKCKGELPTNYQCGREAHKAFCRKYN